MRRGFSIGLCELDNRSSVRQEHGRLAWRVQYSLVGHPHMAIPVPLATSRDAQAAAAWCAVRLPTPERTTLEEFRAAWRAVGGSTQATADMLVADCCRW